jgi:outer membrane protein insertion porin family
VAVSYGLSRTNITTYNQASELLFTQVQYRSIAGPSALEGIVASTITPTISYNTINNPMNATKGKSIFYSLAFTGGPLGGNVNTITNTGEIKYFHPINKKRNAIGLRFLGAFTTGYGGKEVPPYSRFYMGGEQDIRGFDIRGISPVTYIPSVFNQTISYFNNHNLGPGGFPTLASFSVPLVAYTITFPGGDTELLGSFEYRIPIAGPVSMSLFVDSGTDGVARKNSLQLDSTGVANINSQFPLVNQPQELQIAPGTNFKMRMSTGVEFIINLPIVQAPFRIYYAYNPLRLHETIVAPYDRVNFQSLYLTCASLGLLDPQNPSKCNPTILAQIQPILQNPGRLNYFEPQSTFRFSVSRTF